MPCFNCLIKPFKEEKPLVIYSLLTILIIEYIKLNPASEVIIIKLIMIIIFFHYINLLKASIMINEFQTTN